MLDLLVSVLPRYTGYADPPAGASLINAADKRAGFKSKAVDFNIIFYHETHHKDLKLWEEIDVWMDQVPNQPTFRKPLSKRAKNEFNRIFNIWTDIIEKNNPRCLGLSIFSTYSVKPALEFIPKLRKRFPGLTVIVGGAGTTPRNSKLYRLVDYYVEGEGEEAIVNILEGLGDKAPGVNGNEIKQMDNLDIMPWPDYSDYDLGLYERKGKMVRVTASRGCIRRCNFCDVYKMWPLFRYRSGSNIADEIFHQWRTLSTKPDMFIFTDSLINGNVQMLQDTCQKLVTYKKEFSEFKPSFKGQFIAASPKFFTIQLRKPINEISKCGGLCC